MKRLICFLCVMIGLAFGGPASAGTDFGKAVVGDISGQALTVGPSLAPGAGAYYSADSWDLAGINPGDFSILSSETGMQGHLHLYNSAFAQVSFRPTGLGYRQASLQMHWTTYTAKSQNGKLVFTVKSTGVSSVSVEGQGVSADPQPGTPFNEAPTYCLASDPNQNKAMRARIYTASGNIQAANLDPIRTRGYPLTLNIYINSQNLSLSGPMRNATFTYGILVTRMKYAVGATYVPHWLVIDGDGTVLDFGTSAQPATPAPGIYSTLYRANDNSFVLFNAGPPEHLHKYGNYTYWFNSDGLLTKLQDPAGNFQVLSYSNSHVTRVDDVSSKKSISFLYNGSYIERIVPNGGPFSTRLAYSYGNLTTVDVLNANDTLATRTAYTYSGSLLTAITRDDNPNTIATFTYTIFPTMRSSSGIVKANVSTKLFTSRINWSADAPTQGGAKVEVTNAKGAVTVYRVSTAGDVLSVTPPGYGGSSGSTTRAMAYDANHNQLSLTGPGISQTFSFDSHGQLTKSSDGTGAFRAYSYSGADLKRVDDALGTLATLYYNDVRFPHIPTSIQDAEGAAWTRTLNAFGQTTTLTPPPGSADSALSITYDETPSSATYGWPVKISRNGVTTLLTGYTAMGDLSRTTTSPDGVKNYSETLEYDGAQRATKRIRADGKASYWAYSGRNLASFTDEAGITTGFDWCAPCGKLMGLTGPLGWSNHLTQDADRNVTGFIDARKSTTTYVPGFNGELLQTTYPDNAKLAYSYQANGLLREQKNARAQTVTLTYDLAGRPLTRKTPTVAEQYAYFPDGKLKSVSAGTYSVAYTYTVNRHVQTIVSTVKTDSTVVSQTIAYDYYADGKLASLTWTCGGKLVCRWDYAYGTAGRLSQVTNGFGETTTYLYDRQGKLLSQSNANKTSAAYSYNDALGWVTRIAQKSNNSLFASYDLQYDGGLNRVPLLTGAKELDGSVAAYQYDTLKRLTRAGRAGKVAYDESYEYDLTGNLLKVNGSTFGSYDAANKCLTSALGALTHDADGNVLGIGGASGSKFAWDPDSKLTAQSKGTQSVAYGYDFQGHRILAQPAGGVATVYIYSGDTLLGEVTNGVPSAIYTWGEDGLVSERVLQKTNTGTTAKSYWYHFGPQGETRLLTDSTGIVVASYAYTAYGVAGQTTGTVANPFRYGGKYGYYADGPNGLMLCGHRWYSPSLTRWLSRDPIEYKGGENLYGYCGGNPVGSSDPTGFDPIEDRYNQCIQTLGEENKDSCDFDGQQHQTITAGTDIARQGTKWASPSGLSGAASPLGLIYGCYKFLKGAIGFGESTDQALNKLAPPTSTPTVATPGS